MSRIRKALNRFWTKEDKLKIVNEVLLNCKSSCEVAKEYDISSGMLMGWIIKYNKKAIIQRLTLKSKYCIIAFLLYIY